MGRQYGAAPVSMSNNSDRKMVKNKPINNKKGDIIALFTGILSLLLFASVFLGTRVTIVLAFFGFVMGICAIVLGVQTGPSGKATAGRITGIIGVVLNTIALIILVIILLFFKTVADTVNSVNDSFNDTIDAFNNSSIAENVQNTETIQNNATDLDDIQFGVGEPVVIDGVTITLTDVQEYPDGFSVNEYMNLRPDEGEVFVGLTFDVANDESASDSVSISSLMSFSIYCDGEQQELNLFPSMAEMDTMDMSISPGKSGSGVLGISIPISWQTIEIHYKPNVLIDKHITFFYMK